MDWDPESIDYLLECFLLAKNKNHSGSPLALFHLVAESSADEQMRLRAAVDFKDHLKSRWRPWLNAFPLPDAEKDSIKTLIIPLMLSSTPTIQAQLNEALALIGTLDFPNLWPALVPELRSSLETAINADDFASVNGILATLNSLFKKFRVKDIPDTDPIRLDLKYCFDNFGDPLFKTVEIISRKINDAVAGRSDVVNVHLLIKAQLRCFGIFYSLNFIDMDGFFVDTVDKWMDVFKNYLTVMDQVRGADELQSAVCENISLYIKKEHEPFQSYFGRFVEPIVGVLVDTERLTVTAIEFLTLVSTSLHHGLFSQDPILQQVIEKVVIRNMMLRDEYEELFHKNYVDFTRRDMKVGGTRTRRTVTCQLLIGIARNYEYVIIERLSALINKWLALFDENPIINWKYKECALSLVVLFDTHMQLHEQFSTFILDTEGFFTSFIVSELQSQDVNSFPMLKAAALKFFTRFRFWISETVAMDHVGAVVRLLGSDANVVHSYAAIFIERLLLLNKYEVKPSFDHPILLKNLFDVFKKPGSEVNKYVMRCIVRAEVKSPCDASLVINRICENPKYPDRLFEAFDYLIGDHVNLVPALDVWIVPSLRMILEKRVTVFFPYALRFLSDIVDFCEYLIPVDYKRLIFDILIMFIVEVLLR